MNPLRIWRLDAQWVLRAKEDVEDLADLPGPLPKLSALHPDGKAVVYVLGDDCLHGLVVYREQIRERWSLGGPLGPDPELESAGWCGDRLARIRKKTASGGVRWHLPASSERVEAQVHFHGAASVGFRGQGERALIWDDSGRLIGLDLERRRLLADLRRW